MEREQVKPARGQRKEGGAIVPGRDEFDNSCVIRPKLHIIISYNGGTDIIHERHYSPIPVV